MTYKSIERTQGNNNI